AGVGRSGGRWGRTLGGRSGRLGGPAATAAAPAAILGSLCGGETIPVSVAGPASPQFAPFSLHLSLLLSRISASQLTRWPPPDKREGSAVDPGKRRSLAATPSSPLPCTLVALGLGLRHEKEANELMEDLFETFQDEIGFSNMEDDGPEEEKRVAEPRPNFNTPQALRFEELLANLLNEQHQIAKELFEQLKMKKSSAKQQKEVEKVKPQCKEVHQTLILDPAQRKRLQQQMEQHVQLLTQIHLLATCNPNLNPEASSTRICLKELGTFAQSSIALHHQYNPKFQTLFQPCNLMGAMQLIEDFSTHVSIDCSPHKTVKKTANEFPCLPKQVAWILATSKVFMYPELLPVCSLKAKNPQDKILFTKAEDNLLALGLKHFEGTEFLNPLISKYLLTCKTARQLTVRIKNLNMNRAPDNIIKVSVSCMNVTHAHFFHVKEEHRLPF
uniref:YY1 associated protein 1 n=1 Tax=Colobus angolensis palliatus TaxID=336983 RepID=A0A2K5JTW6_COLAP